MTFHEKLQFLMKITQTTNKDLAESISVDPSLISLFRSGRRKMPRNHNHIKKMAAYFARNINADYQRQAVSEMLDIPMIRSDYPASKIEQLLYEWLRGEVDPVSMLLNTLNEVSVTPSEISGSFSPSKSDAVPQKSSVPENQFFFGNSGKLEAFRQLDKLMPESASSFEFLVISAESMDWLIDDYSLRKNFMTRFISSLNHGMRVRQIMPSMNLLSRCVDSMRQWLPLYATGQVEAYYYPRLRDNLYSRSMMIIPGVCAMVSTSIGADYAEHTTVLTTNQQLIEAYVKEFYLLLSQCKPALRTFTDFDVASECFRKIFYQNRDILQMVSPLSAPTAPPSLLKDCIDSTDNKKCLDTYRLYLDASDFFETRLQSNIYVDISRLPTAEEITKEELPIILPYKLAPDQPCYTPKRYVLHLRNILRLLNQYENYHFVPLDDQFLYAFNLITAEGNTAMLIKTSQPALFMEIDRPMIVQACQEYLYRQAGQIGYKGIYREKTKSRIRSLIQEVEFLSK